MKAIRFSHDYLKLPLNWKNSTAILVGALHEQVKNIKLYYPMLLKYDTEFRGEKGSYGIKFEDAIVLTFIHVHTGMPFTTIRPYDHEKMMYYQSSIAEPFEMVLNK